MSTVLYPYEKSVFYHTYLVFSAEKKQSYFKSHLERASAGDNKIESLSLPFYQGQESEHLLSMINEYRFVLVIHPQTLKKAFLSV